MDKKRIAAVFVAGMFSINLIGCNSQNVQDAYKYKRFLFLDNIR